jgi:hypothetical protein
MKFVIAALFIVTMATACVTPPEIKQALIAKDQAYIENERLMAAYRELLRNISDRHRTWYRFVRSRLILDVAVQWATTDPKRQDVSDGELTDADAEILGPEVVSLINDIRLQSLPERTGSTGQAIFKTGTRSMETVLQQLPELVARVEQNVQKKAGAQPADMAAFDAYRTNIEALRRINAMIKHYLDIDVTVTPAQVQSIAEAAAVLQH